MSNPWTDGLPYFPRSELACKGSGIVRLDPRFAAQLPALRERWGKPLTPTSVCRSPSHNVRSGGHPNSLHLTENHKHPTAAGTMAADLAWRTWTRADRLAFAKLAWQAGWAVGLHDGFIHIDWRQAMGLSPQVFLYGTWTGDFGGPEITRG